MVDYITNEDTIIFSPKFNKSLESKLLLNYKKIIFSNYVLNDYLFEAYENHSVYNFIFIGSKFNQHLTNSLDKLTSLTHLTFGLHFNNPLSNSLESLT